MKRIVFLILGIVILAGVGYSLARYFFTNSQSTSQPTKEKPLYWIDRMEPTIHYSGPGKSRMGMEVEPVYAKDVNKDEGIVKISPAVMENLGVRIAPVIRGPLAREIYTVGYVAVDENALVHIHLYAEGWVHTLKVKTVGEKVNKGQLLLQLYSPTLVNAQEEYLIAKNSGKSDLAQAAEAKLMALGVSKQQIQTLKNTNKASHLVDVYAPQSGFVTELNIREGMWVNPEKELIALVDLSTVWIMAEVYENQSPWVQVGEKAVAKLAFFPDKIWTGHIEYIYPEISAMTRTLKVRIRFANPGYLLKPNMYADVTLFAEPKENTLSIPKEALIPSGSGDRVIVSLGNGYFEPRIVTTDRETDDRIEILSGLQPGENVVTSAQFLIDSEASLQGALERLNAGSTTEGLQQNDSSHH